MATNARNRRLEPAYKQHTAVDDVLGVVLDVEVTTGEANEGDHLLPRVDAVAAATGNAVGTVTADQGYAYGKVYGGLERRGIDPVIPAKKEPIRSRVPLRRFRYDARHDILKCPKGRTLRPQRRVEHGPVLLFDGQRLPGCPMRGRLPVQGAGEQGRGRQRRPPGAAARPRRKERWSRRTPRSTSGTAGARRASTARRRAGTGLARAVRRGLQNMRIQAFLTAAAVNLKRLAAALLPCSPSCRRTDPLRAASPPSRDGRRRLRCGPVARPGAPPNVGFFNSPRVHFARSALAHAGKAQRRIVSAWISTAYAEGRRWGRQGPVAHRRRPAPPEGAEARRADGQRRGGRAGLHGVPAAHRAKLHAPTRSSASTARSSAAPTSSAYSRTRPPS
jgi:hypothetical protein